MYLYEIDVIFIIFLNFLYTFKKPGCLRHFGGITKNFWVFLRLRFCALQRGKQVFRGGGDARAECVVFFSSGVYIYIRERF